MENGKGLFKVFDARINVRNPCWIVIFLIRMKQKRLQEFPEAFKNSYHIN